MKRCKAAAEVGVVIEYSGAQSPLLQMLEVVQKHPMHVGHTFSSQKLAQIRIVEEVLQILKHIIFQNSYPKVTEAMGVHFHCRANVSKLKGWVITKLCFNTQRHGLLSFEKGKRIKGAAERKGKKMNPVHVLLLSSKHTVT